MKKLILLLAITLSFISTTGAQNYMYVGDNQYPSTETWKFNINGNAYGRYLEVTIGRDGSKGLVMLETQVAFNNDYIGGNVYIFLSDGSRITCTDKNIRDYVDSKSVAIYKLTSTEVERMKTNYITQIRFTILPSSRPFNGTYTANNITLEAYYDQEFKRIPPGVGSHYKIDEAIRELF